MAININRGRIYRLIADILNGRHMSRRDLFDSCIEKSGLGIDQINDQNPKSKVNDLRSNIGSVLGEMEARDLIGVDEGGLYYTVVPKPVVIRIEKCEKELIRGLSEKAMTKSEIRDRLKRVFGTDKTLSMRDDDILMSFMGQTLKKLENIGAIVKSGELYSLSERASARADDINQMLALRSEFIQSIHRRGGEFFENYFMTLVGKYCEKQGKRVLECSVKGGSDDGGIDGIIRTEDTLGFKETVMVQTKNRTEIISETDVRGFWGAVCAAKGSRGIFVTSSDFHPGAREFLDGIDDCVGVNGEKLFKMAIECKYGIICRCGMLAVDTKII